MVFQIRYEIGTASFKSKDTFVSPFLKIRKKVLKNGTSLRGAKIVEANGTVRFKNVNNCLNTNIYSYLETSGGKSSNPYLNVVNFFNTRVD
jgi:hypothetical protein